jgi:hypothetical protein
VRLDDHYSAQSQSRPVPQSNPTVTVLGESGSNVTTSTGQPTQVEIDAFMKEQRNKTALDYLKEGDTASYFAFQKDKSESIIDFNIDQNANGISGDFITSDDLNFRRNILTAFEKEEGDLKIKLGLDVIQNASAEGSFDVNFDEFSFTSEGSVSGERFFRVGEVNLDDGKTTGNLTIDTQILRFNTDGSASFEPKNILDPNSIFQ